MRVPTTIVTRGLTDTTKDHGLGLAKDVGFRYIEEAEGGSQRRWMEEGEDDESNEGGGETTRRQRWAMSSEQTTE